MLASQLIYTSWKNGDNPNKGFMIYSQTLDISAEDSKLILAVMKYKPLPNLPFTPTFEEIENNFPRNVAYFQLPSGKYCLAQASYVGQDYSSRWGNYIIHAFVIDQPTGLIPETYINSDLFKRFLTDQELNLPNAPASLPKVELPNVGKTLTEQEIKAFFTEERKHTLKLLAQSILEAHNENNKVYLKDDWKNLKYWLGALALILPKEFISSFSFATYELETFECLNLICVDRIPELNTYSYDGTEVKVYTFDLIQNEISVSEVQNRYINEICDKLVSNYFGAITFNNEVIATSKKYQTNDLVTAYLYNSIEKNNYDAFTSFDEIKEVYKTVSSHPANNKQQLADNTYAEIKKAVKKGKTVKEQKDIFKFLKELYPNLSSQNQNDYIITYYEQSILGIENGNVEEIFNTMISGMVDDWKRVSENLLTQANLYKVTKADNDNNYLFATLLLVKLYKENNNSTVSNFIELNLNAYFEKLAKHNNHEYIKKFIVLVKEVNPNLVKVIMDKYVDKNLESLEKDLTNTFAYLTLFNDKPNYFWETLTKMLNTHPTVMDSLVEFYYKYRENNKSQVSQLESNLPNASIIKFFIKKVDLKQFEYKENFTITDLVYLYQQTVELKKLNDLRNQSLYTEIRKLFIVKVKNHIAKQAGKLKEIFELHKKLCGSKINPEKDVELVEIFHQAVFKNSTLKDYRESNLSKNELAQFVSSVEACGLEVPNRVELYEYALDNLTNINTQLHSNKVKEMIENMGLDTTKPKRSFKPKVEFEKEEKLKEKEAKKQAKIAAKEAKKQAKMEAKQQKEVEEVVGSKAPGVEEKQKPAPAPEKETTNEEVVVENTPVAEPVIDVDSKLKPLYLQNSVSEKLKEEFFSCFGVELLKVDFTVAKNQLTDHLMTKVLDYLVEPLSGYKGFDDAFLKVLSIDLDSSSQYLVGIYSYIFLKDNAFTKQLSKVLDIYFEQIGKSQANKVFNYVLNHIEEFKKLQVIVDEYNNKRSSFFDKIKNIFKK